MMGPWAHSGILGIRAVTNNQQACKRRSTSFSQSRMWPLLKYESGNSHFEHGWGPNMSHFLNPWLWNLKLHEGSFPALIIIPSVVLFAPLRAAEHFCEIKVVCFWAVTWDTVTNYWKLCYFQHQGETTEAIQTRGIPSYWLWNILPIEGSLQQVGTKT